MKVLVLSHMYSSTFNETAGIFVHEQVKALVSAGVQVRVVSPTAWTPWFVKHLRRKWREIAEIPREAVWDGIQVDYPRYLVFPRAWFFTSSGRRMARGVNKTVEVLHREFPFDLIHAHVALPDGYAGALAASAWGVPLVVTIHGKDLQHTVHRGDGGRRALGFALNRASRVIVVSCKLKRLAEGYFGSRENLRVVPNGVDAREVVTAQGTIAKEHGESPLLLSVSNLAPTKGVDLNLLALQELLGEYPELQYVVIGGGLEETRLRRLAGTLGLEHRVTFLGRQPHHRVMEHMAKCDIFTLPSWEEGFGVVYLEAMANGKPVVGCRGEGIEDVIEHGKTGLLAKPRDVDSLVEALNFSLSHPEEAKAMGERARKLVLENYTWEKNAEKTIKIYQEVLNGR